MSEGPKAGTPTMTDVATNLDTEASSVVSGQYS